MLHNDYLSSSLVGPQQAKELAKCLASTTSQVRKLSLQTVMQDTRLDFQDVYIGYISKLWELPSLECDVFRAIRVVDNQERTDGK